MTERESAALNQLREAVELAIKEETYRHVLDSFRYDLVWYRKKRRENEYGTDDYKKYFTEEMAAENTILRITSTAKAWDGIEIDYAPYLED